MTMLKKSTIALLLLVLGLSVVSSKRVANLDDDLEINVGGDDSILSSEDAYNEMTSQKKTAPKAPVAKVAKVEKLTMEYRFEDGNQWLPRGTLEVSKDSQGKTVGVSLRNVEIKADISQTEIEKKCSEGKLYQLRIKENGLVNSIPACHYSKHGLNETLQFHTDFAGQISSFSYDVVDIQFLASLEKNPKKRRLMTTKQFETFDTKAVLQQLAEGPRPIFTKYKYDATGRELKEKSPEQQAVAQEENQSFLGKYWLYILIAFLVLPNLLGAPEEGQGAPGAAGAGAKK